MRTEGISKGNKDPLIVRMSNYPESCNLCRIGLVHTYADANKVFMMGGYYLICAVKKGRIILHISDMHIELGRGDMYIVPPEVALSIEYVEKNTEFYGLEFTEEFLQYNPRGLTVKDRLFNFLKMDKVLEKHESLKRKISLTAQDQVFVFKQIEQCHYEMLKRRECMFEVLQCALMTITTFFGRKYLYESGNANMELRYQRLNQILLDSVDYIHQHYMERIVLDDIAAKFGISKAGYCDLFKKGTGTTFAIYLNNIRCEKVVQLLCNDQLSLEEIAEKTGYNDVTSLHRNFVSRYGKSPGKYRKEYIKS